MRSRPKASPDATDIDLVSLGDPEEYSPPRPSARWAAGALVAAAAVVTRVDPAGVAAGGALLAVVMGLRRAAARGGFGFGDGFVRFRPELGWPAGVQEEDGANWVWPRTARGRGVDRPV